MSKKKHARFAPSAMHRIIECPGSVKLSDGIAREDSVYSIEGTTAHTVLEYLLKNRKRPLAAAAFLRSRYPLQMVVHAEWALSEIEKLTPKGAELLTETKSDLSFIHPEFYGTADAVVLDHYGTLNVIDYKYGKGVWVDVVENPQLVAYALGIAHKYHYNFERVTTTIAQPRFMCNAGPVRYYTYEIEHLFTWRERFLYAIYLAEKSRPKFNAGEWCRFCPAKNICETYSMSSQSAIPDWRASSAADFEDAPELPDEGAM